MDEISLPQHVIERLERRWRGKLEQLARLGAWGQPVKQDDPLRSPEVQRWLASALRPPDPS
jgi:hypothetical protein